MNKGLFTSGCEENSVDKFTRDKRSEIMARVRSRGNATTELRALRILRSGAITGWRRHLPIFGRPDFAFFKSRTALFIDGCFWHGCPRCYEAPKSSSAFWLRKLAKNRKRDMEVSRQLRRRGWKVLRVWECRLKSPAYLLRRIRDAISK
jgi:DNA mismatch endonuclease (patch repair protein)